MGNNKKINILIILVIVLAGWFFYNNYFNKPALVTVVGTGKVTAKPQLVKFTVSVINSASSATQAIKDNQRMVNELVLQMGSLGISEKDINTAYVRVLSPQATGLANYQAVNTIDATLKDISKFDNLVIQLYGNGATSVSNIVFTTEDSQILEKQATTLAFEDANQRAKELAKSTKKRVGKMVSIATGEVGEAGAVSGQTDNKNVNASLSQIEISRQVSIVFELR